MNKRTINNFIDEETIPGVTDTENWDEVTEGIIDEDNFTPPDIDFNAGLEMDVKIGHDEYEALLSSLKVYGRAWVGYLVDQYEQSQAYRIRAENQARSLLQGKDNFATDAHPASLEKQLRNARINEAYNKKCMDIVTDAIPVCRWMKQITGISTVLSAYLYAAFDVRRGHYATDFLSYAGLNNNNNPWLGTEKAGKLVTSILEMRETGYIDEKTGEMKIESPFKLSQEILLILFEEVTGTDNDKLWNKFIKACGKCMSEVDENGNPPEIPQVLHGAFEDIGYDYPLYDAENNPEVVNHTAELAEYIGAQNFKDYIGDWTIMMASMLTTRKPVNIERGTRKSMSNKSNPAKWYMRSSDLKAYLAKPPYNTALKTKCYLIGKSFVFSSNKPRSLYGRLFKERKAYEMAKNMNGDYADQAAKLLAEKNWDHNTSTYKTLCEGRLSEGHINQRAMRWVTKIFISHVYEAMYYAEFHKEPKQFYALAHLETHDEYIAPEVDYHPYIDGTVGPVKVPRSARPKTPTQPRKAAATTNTAPEGTTAPKRRGRPPKNRNVE